MTDLSQPQQKPLAKAKIPLEKFNLSMRAYNCLKRAQVNFVSDLMNFSYEDLLEIKSFGSKSADEVIDALERIGMSLRQSRSPALAEQPVVPTDEELDEYALFWWGSDTDERTVTDVIECCSMAAFARAVLARWGQS
jgi:hypothetical protein